MDIKIPGVNPKYNTLAIAAIVILVFIILFPSVIKNLISGIIKGVGGGLTEGIGSVLKPAPDPATQAAHDAVSQWLSDYDTKRKNDCFSTYLYDNNPDAASIDRQTAANLWQNVKDCVGWFSNDMSDLQGKFEQVVGNQVDISFVSRVAFDDKGQDLYFYLAHNFNDWVNLPILKTFIQWANSLPTTYHGNKR